VAPYTSQQHRAAAAEASAKLASEKLRAALPDALCKVSRLCICIYLCYLSMMYIGSASCLVAGQALPDALCKVSRLCYLSMLYNRSASCLVAGHAHSKMQGRQLAEAPLSRCWCRGSATLARSGTLPLGTQGAGRSCDYVEERGLELCSSVVKQC
jgi:hypothetical protein